MRRGRGKKGAGGGGEKGKKETRGGERGEGRGEKEGGRERGRGGRGGVSAGCSSAVQSLSLARRLAGRESGPARILPPPAPRERLMQLYNEAAQPTSALRRVPGCCGYVRQPEPDGRNTANSQHSVSPPPFHQTCLSPCLALLPSLFLGLPPSLSSWSPSLSSWSLSLSSWSPSLSSWSPSLSFSPSHVSPSRLMCCWPELHSEYTEHGRCSYTDPSHRDNPFCFVYCCFINIYIFLTIMVVLCLYLFCDCNKI